MQQARDAVTEGGLTIVGFKIQPPGDAPAAPTPLPTGKPASPQQTQDPGIALSVLAINYGLFAWLNRRGIWWAQPSPPLDLRFKDRRRLVHALRRDDLIPDDIDETDAHGGVRLPARMRVYFPVPHSIFGENTLGNAWRRLRSTRPNVGCPSITTWLAHRHPFGWMRTVTWSGLHHVVPCQVVLQFTDLDQRPKSDLLREG